MKPRRLAFLGLYLVILVGAAELACRIYWKIRHGTPLTRTSDLLYSFYPELRFVDGRPIRRGDHEIDLLLLGGSVVNNHYGNIAHLLEERLTKRLRRRVIVHNMGRTAHTSLDSFYKYQHMAGKEFDLVLIYHGINEARANNVPPDLFRVDYSHYSWYQAVHSLHERWEVPLFVLPYTLGDVARTARERWGSKQYLTKGRPYDEWLEHGSEIKTAESFYRNLSAILEIAAERGEKVVLMSFAYYIAPGYREDAFRRFALDYSLHAFPIELWGRPADVAAAVDAHNLMAERLAAATPHAAFVDQNTLISKSAETFNDVCHLTGRGCEIYVDNLLRPILAALQN